MNMGSVLYWSVLFLHWPSHPQDYHKAVKILHLKQKILLIIVCTVNILHC